MRYVLTKLEKEVTTTKIVDENVIFQIKNTTIEIVFFSFIDRIVKYNKYFHYNLMS